jgi:hypothetical protein
MRARMRMRRFVGVAVVLLTAVGLVGPARAATQKPATQKAEKVLPAHAVARAVTVADFEARVAWSAWAALPPLPPRPSDARNNADLAAAYKSAVAKRAEVRAALDRAIALQHIANHLRLAWAAPIIEQPDSPILGPSLLTAPQLAAYARSLHVRMHLSVPIELLAKLFIYEGQVEGVRGDVAFAQAMLETGTFSGFVGPNNFGALGGCAACSHDGFATAQQGVRAQIELLRWRADTTLRRATDFAGQPSTLPDRFLHVGHVSPTWQALGGQWSPDPQYGVHVYAFYVRMLHWAADHPTP